VIDSPTLPDTGFVRLRTILSILPISRSTFYGWVADGRVSKPRKIGARISLWPASEIRELLASIEGGQHGE
jgi:predicted DNA-binding transcriptional regulator AlpA